MTQWRYRCPNGHTTVRERRKHNQETDDGNKPQSRFYCESCQRNGNDPHHDELKDMKTGNRITKIQHNE